MTVNTMDLLGVNFNEEVIGNLIVGLINSSDNFRRAFSRHILEISNVEGFDVKAYSKEATSKGIPDIIISAESDDEIIISIVEEKLKANEGHNQTFIYTEEVIKEEIIKESNNKKINFKYIYLTLIEDEKKINYGYINKTFKDLINDVWVEIEDEGLNRLYKDFITNIMKFYTLQELPESAKRINVLLDKDEKEKMFIKFRALVLSLKYSNNLAVEFFGKETAGDEISFISKILKNRWIGAEAKWNCGLYEIGEDTFEIHIESQFNITSEKLVLYIHYEPNPYVTRYKLRSVATNENVDAFERQRRKVLENVHNQIDKFGDSYIRKYEGRNTIAYVEFQFEKYTTVGDFKEVFLYYIDVLSHMVDNALDMA